jgi:hypothetical protein
LARASRECNSTYPVSVSGYVGDQFVLGRTKVLNKMGNPPALPG